MLADERVTTEAVTRLKAGVPRDKPEGVWCTLCGHEADPATALLVENRALICGACVKAVALAAGIATRQPSEPH
jgi:hypothetical protein